MLVFSDPLISTLWLSQHVFVLEIKRIESNFSTPLNPFVASNHVPGSEHHSPANLVSLVRLDIDVVGACSKRSL